MNVRKFCSKCNSPLDEGGGAPAGQPVQEPEPSVEPTVEEQPTVQEPQSAVEQPSVEEPQLAGEPMVEEPQPAEEPMVEEPQPAVEQPSVEEPQPAGEPTVEEPQPAVEQPSVEEPQPADQPTELEIQIQNVMQEVESKEKAGLKLQRTLAQLRLAQSAQKSGDVENAQRLFEKAQNTMITEQNEANNAELLANVSMDSFKEKVVTGRTMWDASEKKAEGEPEKEEPLADKLIAGITNEEPIEESRPADQPSVQEPQPSVEQPAVEEPQPLDQPSVQEPQSSGEPPVEEPQPTVEQPSEEPMFDPIAVMNQLRAEAQAQPKEEEPKEKEPEEVPSIVPEFKEEEMTFTPGQSPGSQPVTEEPQAEEPMAEQPQAEEPHAEEPQPAEEPQAEEPQPAGEPMAEQPQAEEPMAEQPQAEEPQAEEPQAEEPQAEQPQAEGPQPAEQPQAEEPMAEEPQAEGPQAEEPQAEEPQAEEPQAEEPQAEEPQAEGPQAEEPQAEEPQAEEPQAEEPQAEQPQAEGPQAEEPQAEEPQAEEPAVAEQSGDAGPTSEGEAILARMHKAVDEVEEGPDMTKVTAHFTKVQEAFAAGKFDELPQMEEKLLKLIKLAKKAHAKVLLKERLRIAGEGLIKLKGDGVDISKYSPYYNEAKELFKKKKYLSSGKKIKKVEKYLRKKGILEKKPKKKPTVAEDKPTEQPQAEEPQTEEPQAEEPQAEEPQAEEPMAEEPQAEEPQPAEQPQAEEPQAEEPQTEEPQAEEPQAEEPQTEEPQAEEPVAEQPVAEEPQAEEPVAEEPQAEEPVAEEQVAEESAGPESANVRYEKQIAEMTEQVEKCINEGKEPTRTVEVLIQAQSAYEGRDYELTAEYLSKAKKIFDLEANILHVEKEITTDDANKALEEVKSEVSEEPKGESEPSVEEPQPTVEEPVVEEQPTAEEPTAPEVDQPIAEEPQVEEPVVEEPEVEEQPTAEEPTAPEVDQPIAEEPPTEEPQAEEPVVGGSQDQGPTQEEQNGDPPEKEEPCGEEKGSVMDGGQPAEIQVCNVGGGGLGSDIDVVVRQTKELEAKGYSLPGTNSLISELKGFLEQNDFINTKKHLKLVKEKMKEEIGEEAHRREEEAFKAKAAKAKEDNLGDIVGSSVKAIDGALDRGADDDGGPLTIRAVSKPTPKDDDDAGSLTIKKRTQQSVKKEEKKGGGAGMNEFFLLTEARLAITEGDMDKALEKYQKIFDMNPGNSEAKDFLNKHAPKEPAPQPVQPMMNTGPTIDYERVAVLMHMADEHLVKGNHDSAKIYYEEVLALDPNNADAKDGIAKCTE